ncbi:MULTISPECIES: phosphate ABC transporter permease PstA [unclassified Nocardioides]|uniref:phosphate ABC transporter permease PstA n=1 Tax=Nocardioides sp. URHA0032 TaxID=1380388 RepID=UPI0009DCC8D5|nr:phosphate ABC transporter permease PstA [Nocardioides sp. URHA0032]
MAATAPRKVKVGGVSTELVLHVGSAAFGALALVWLMYQQLLPITGTIGFWLSWYAVFLVLLAAASATTLDRIAVVDRIVGALVTTAGAILVACLAGIVVFTAVRGWTALKHVNFYHDTTAYIGPDASLDQGGIWAAMVGTLEQVAISMIASVPLGIATAVYLSEVRGRLARVVRTVVEAMSAVPTIVAGLFIYSMLILKFGQERSGFAASLALCVSMIPVVVTTAEVVLRLVPGGLREASLALGTTQWQTVRRVVLPTARSGLVTAVLLGVARVIGETSPVLLVAGSTSELNYDAFHGPQVSLPLFVFNEMRLPLDQAIARAFGAAVVLLVLVVVLFGLARVIGGKPPGHLSRRQQRRLAVTAGLAPAPNAVNVGSLEGDMS